jgi:multidrug efflux pump subunit AcrA (membrane-fusion protein)
MFFVNFRVAAAVLSFVLVAAGLSASTCWVEGAPPEAKQIADPWTSQHKPDDLVRIPSQHDGVVKFIGTEVAKGDKTPESRQFKFIDGNTERRFRRLKVGEMVDKGQLLAMIDDTLPRSELAIKHAKLRAAEADKTSSEKTREEARERWNIQKRMYQSPIRDMSLDDVRGAELTYNRYVHETIGKEQAVKVAEEELAQAKKVLDCYQIRSPSRGTIWRLHKHDGEAVRYLETMVTLKLIPEAEEQERPEQ